MLSFFDPFVCFVNSIPSCIVGGVCIALYGFIAVSGLKMLQPVDLNDNRNLFVVAAILVPGIGGLTLNFAHITVSAIATGLILGIIINVIFNRRSRDSFSLIRISDTLFPSLRHSRLDIAVFHSGLATVDIL